MSDENTLEDSVASYKTKALGHDQQDEDRKLAYHLGLLKTDTAPEKNHERKSIPIFSAAVLRRWREYFTQYGFIAGQSSLLKQPSLGSDPRLFFNIAAPSSAFICGSQGSGKSHTLSCLLENCLMKSDVSELTKPLSGLLFHYDNFIGDKKGIPCEAAHLATGGNIKVRVLCAPTNFKAIKVNTFFYRLLFF
jgi:hypothetical protein